MIDFQRRDHILGLIEAKQFEEAEAQLLALQEERPNDLETFLDSAQAMRREGEKKRAAALLSLVADGLPAGLARLHALEELARHSGGGSLLAKARESVTATLAEAWKGEALAAELKKAFDLDAATTPAEVADVIEKYRRWLPYPAGSLFFMAGSGLLRVLGANLALGNLKMEGEGRKPVSVAIGVAAKRLIPVPEGHPLRDHAERPQEIAALVKSNPVEVFRRLVVANDGALTVAEIKELLAPMVPKDDWTRYWGKVQKHPQVVHAGSGKDARYGWTDDHGDALSRIRADFEAADLDGRMALLRKHGKKLPQLAKDFAARMETEAARLRTASPAVCFRLLLALEKLGSGRNATWGPIDLVRDHSPRALLGALEDRASRERYYELLREARPTEWAELYRQAFRVEDDPKLLARLGAVLESGAPDVHRQLLEEIARQPQRIPRGFLWWAEGLDAGLTAGGAAPDQPAAVLGRLLQAAGWKEMAPFRARCLALFERGRLAISLVGKLTDPENGSKILTDLATRADLPLYQVEMLKEAIERRFPDLRSNDGRSSRFFATAASAEKKRSELEHMLKVELPANGQAMKEAVALGDLSENFEYKSARQKHEYLTARIAKLQEELNVVQIIDPKAIDTSEVRVGTRIVLGGDGGEKTITLLGPWESAPESAVYSYESELGASLLGRRPGDAVAIGDERWSIKRIEAWSEREA